MDETTTQQTDRCCDVGDSPPLCCGAQAADNQPAAPGRAPCCAPARPPWVVGEIDTPAGPVPHIAAALTLADRLAAARVRLGIGRTSYAVPAGLCAVGSPDAASPVLVTANYKLSFDRLRERLGGMDAWILVLDTKGINVWCAAGKGTFGTDEIVRRVEAVRLGEVVSHRKLLVPQLGAPGVAAHEVKKRSGFRVVYGPVRAEDLPAFLDADFKATPEMRRVRFPFRDRMALIPVELVMSAKYVLLVAACLFVLGGLGLDGYSWTRAAGVGIWSAVVFLATCVGSIAFASALLPWLPGRALGVKGAWLGLALLTAVAACGLFRMAAPDSRLTVVAWCFLVPTVASFMTMNFTGSTTYTSLSGVRREMAVAVPIQALCALVGVTLWLVGRFV